MSFCPEIRLNSAAVSCPSEVSTVSRQYWLNSCIQKSSCEVTSAGAVSSQCFEAIEFCRGFGVEFEEEPADTDLFHWHCFYVVFFVFWRLRSSEPCGCTLTLRDRFLSLSVLLRVMNRKMGMVHAVVLKRRRGRGTEHKSKLTKNIVGCWFLLEETNWSWAKR